MSRLEPALPEVRRVADAPVPGREEVASAAADTGVRTCVVAPYLLGAVERDGYPPERNEAIRHALRESDRDGAITAWMDATGQRLNVFADETVWTNALPDEQRFDRELAAAPTSSQPGAD